MANIKSGGINGDIRELIQKYDIKYYEIADRLNMKPSNFSTLLKMELDTFRRDNILEIIEKLKKEKGEKNNE